MSVSTRIPRGENNDGGGQGEDAGLLNTQTRAGEREAREIGIEMLRNRETGIWGRLADSRQPSCSVPY